MQGHAVAPQEAGLIPSIGDPRLLALRRAGADAVPNAGEEVADAEEHDRQFHDVHHEAQLLALQVLQQYRDLRARSVLHTRQPQQPQHAGDAEEPRGLAEARPAHAENTAADEQFGPVEANDHQVEDTPSPQVSPDDCPRCHDHGPAAVRVARQAGHRDVQGPEKTCDPEHHVEEDARRRVHQLKRNHETVVAYEQEAGYVPGHTLEGARPYHHGLHQPLLTDAPEHADGRERRPHGLRALQAELLRVRVGENAQESPPTRRPRLLFGALALQNPRLVDLVVRQP
mmetsp:Transcript_60907/g.199427  ORF Transcript_60907/g.199427 Transcript_60907/m.199427 type:complete len:285 (-) Transcript_60907:108-962(-)